MDYRLLDIVNYNKQLYKYVGMENNKICLHPLDIIDRYEENNIEYINYSTELCAYSNCMIVNMNKKPSMQSIDRATIENSVFKKEANNPYLIPVVKM